jgi:hypothetical protein
MKTFQGLPASEASLEFALCVLHTMLTNDRDAINAIFDEAKEVGVLPAEKIESLRTGSLDILPVKMMYENSEKEQMKQFQDFRDLILDECRMNN